MSTHDTIHRALGRRSAVAVHRSLDWIASDSQTRAILTDIANWVDENLAVDPDKKGHDRSDLSARVLAVPVSSARVSVVYQVLPEDRQVRVVRLVFRR